MKAHARMKFSIDGCGGTDARERLVGANRKAGKTCDRDSGAASRLAHRTQPSTNRYLLLFFLLFFFFFFFFFFELLLWAE